MGKKSKNRKKPRKQKAKVTADDADDGGDGAVEEASSSPTNDLVPFTPEEESKELAALTREEKILACADLFGKRVPAHGIDLVPFERELNRIPADRKAAFRKACQKGCYTAKQARLFLRIENYDARAAAERMVKYWSMRHAMRGEDAFDFGDDFGHDRSEEDFRRVRDMAEDALSDPEADKETKAWAEVFVVSYRRGHLQLMEEDVNDLPDEEKACLVEAFTTHREIAADEGFLLQFLHCEDYDTKRAAQRMARYWDFRFSLFGPEDACGSLSIEYLMEHHPAELMSCLFMIAPGTDASGRGILHWCVDRVYEDGLTDEGMLKVIWYLYHTMLENKSIRENGLVLINNQRDVRTSKPRWNLFSKYIEFAINCMPIKIRCGHDCYPPASVISKLVAPVVKYLVGKKMRCRYWIHEGTLDEIASQLETCGIARDQIPTTLGGEIDFDVLAREWIEDRRSKGL